MTVLRFDGAEGSSFDLSDTRNLRITQVLTTEANNWRYTNENGTTVQFLGTGLIYDDSGRPIAGTIETVRVVLPSGDVFAINQVLDAASIAAQPESLWDTVLSGKDIINVRELGLVDGRPSVVFGDRIEAARSGNANVLTGVGGNDVFILGAGSYRLLGDLETVNGVEFSTDATGGTKDLFARYQGGNDLITGADSDRLQRISGDAGFIGANGTLLGGNDNLSIVTSDENSTITGDAEEAFGLKGATATVIGGDDDIKGLKDNVGILIGDLGIARNFVVLKGGDDTIGGGDGDELISGDMGFLIGNRGISITGGNDIIDGDGGDDIIFGDIAEFGGPQPKAAGSGVKVNGGNDTIDGGEGFDKIFGQGGNDRLNGGRAIDELSGGSGRDVLSGGELNDVLTGGRGADVFLYESFTDSSFGSFTDLITDFSSKQGDRIDLALVDANLQVNGIQAFEFIGKAGSGELGQLRFAHAEGNTFLRADINGDGDAEFEINLEGRIKFTEDDFLF